MDSSQKGPEVVIKTDATDQSLREESKDINRDEWSLEESFGEMWCQAFINRVEYDMYSELNRDETATWSWSDPDIEDREQIQSEDDTNHSEATTLDLGYWDQDDYSDEDFLVAPSTSLRMTSECNDTFDNANKRTFEASEDDVEFLRSEVKKAEAETAFMLAYKNREATAKRHCHINA